MVTQYTFWFDVSGVIFDKSFGSDFGGGFSQSVELEKFAEGVDDNKYVGRFQSSDRQRPMEINAD
jgi:hypothetical protein